MSAEIAPMDFEEILQEPDVLYCFNPSDKTLEKSCDGNTYVFCPASCTSPKCIAERKHERGPGVSPVKSSVKVWSKNKNVVKVDRMTAKEIVSFLCGPDGRTGPLGIAGLRPMTNNPERDEQIRADAEKAWRTKRFMDASNVVRQHEATMQIAKTDPNILAPVVT